MKVVSSAEAPGKYALALDVVTERYDYVARVEAQDQMSVRIHFEYPAHVQGESGLLAPVDDEVRLETRPHFGEDAEVPGVLSCPDPE